MDEKNSNKNKNLETPKNATSNNIKISYPEENNEKNIFIDKIFFGKYKVIKKIGEGSQSMIFSGENIKTNEGIAIKVEKRKKEEDCLLKQEIKYLIKLKEHEGIVNIITCGKSGEYMILIEKLLGKSLDFLYLDSSKNFTLDDICQIAIQCIDRLEYIHSKGIIHCDIKPENFSIGLKDPNVIYLIDFGLCQDYKNIKTGKHIEFSFTGYMTGTARYASRNALRGKALSRRDDMESFIYMILYFLSKKLPWQGIRAKTLTGRYKKIFIYKEQFKYEEFCKKFPKEITTIVKYIRNLSFKEKPNYDYMRKLFKKILLDNNSFISGYFSWMINMKDIEIARKRANSETRTKIEQKKIIKSSILKLSNAINPKESILGVTNLKLSKFLSNGSILNLGESNITVYAEENKDENNNKNNSNENNINNENNIINENNNINNNNDDIFNNDDLFNNIKEVTEMPIEEKENIKVNIDNDIDNQESIENNENTNTNELSTEAKIKQELEKYDDDEKEKKYELKKELEIIKEVDEEYDDDFEDISKTRGGSVHIYYKNINNFNFKSNNNKKTPSCFKKNENKKINKEIENEINDEENIIEKDENKENIKSENKINDFKEEKMNKKNENEEIKQKENEIKNNENKNLTKEKEIEKEEDKKEIKNKIIKNNLEKKEDNEIKTKNQNDENIINCKNDNNKEINIEPPKTEVRSNSFSHKIGTNKLKDINANLLSNKEKKEINHQKNNTDDKIKYASIGSKDYAQMKKGNKKVIRKIDGKNKNQNCIII